MAFVRSVVVESLEWLRIADIKQNQAMLLSSWVQVEAS